MKHLYLLSLFLLFGSVANAADNSIAQEYKYRTAIPNKDAVTDVFREVPASASADGRHPGLAVDTSYIYITVSDNTWMRVAIATWSPAAISGSLELEGSAFLIELEGKTDVLDLE